HQESDRGPMSRATKAVVELLDGTYGERGRLFAMKRTAGLVIGAGFFKRNVAIDDLDDVDAAQQRRNKIVWNHRFEIGDDFPLPEFTRVGPREVSRLRPHAAPSATGPESPVARTRHTAGNVRIIGWRVVGGRVTGVKFSAARRRALFSRAGRAAGNPSRS